MVNNLKIQFWSVSMQFIIHGCGSTTCYYSRWVQLVLSLIETEVAQSCPILCDLMDYSLPGSSVHGIFQAGVLEWVAISFSRGSSQPRDWTRVSCTAGRRFNLWATREALPLIRTEYIVWLFKSCPDKGWTMKKFWKSFHFLVRALSKEMC